MSKLSSKLVNFILPVLRESTRHIGEKSFSVTNLVCVLFIAVMAIPTAAANGTIRGGDNDSYLIPDAEEDHIYRKGRSIFEGRHETIQGYSYCVALDGKRVGVKNRTMRSFKKSSYAELGAALYDCDNPDTPLVEQIPDLEFQFVLYYLNKRYKLTLSDIPSG